MLSALSGIRPQADDGTDRLRDQDSDTDKGEGVKSPKQFVDVICEWPPTAWYAVPRELLRETADRLVM